MADVSDWLRESGADLDRARAALRRDDEAYALVHAHQPVEKALKAMQVDALDTYERGHNLVQLGQPFEIPARFERTLEDLTPTYTAARYPDMPDPAIDDPARLVDEADGFLTWVRTEWHTGDI